MERLSEAENYLKVWQEKLNLADWQLSVKLVDFNRTDFEQTGDLEVDKDNKSAVILISKKDTGKDLNEVVLHELVHLILWDLDCQIEGLTPDKSAYLETLEATVEKLTKIIKTVNT